MNETYAGWFRASTPCLRAHRGRTFVVLLGADALGSENAINIVHDLALLHVLGVRLVVVHGAEVEARMRALRLLGHPYTDAEIAGAAKAVAGRTEMDAMIAYLQGLGTAIRSRR